jgi:cobalt-zinc-cadmium efflux system membrane fusion protein
MRVRRGEVLATLEDPQYITLQQDFLTANARLAYLSADLSRQEALNQDKSASDKALQLVRSEYQMQKILTKSLSEKLKLIGLEPDRLSVENISRNIQIYSPINGFVSEVKANIGKYVLPTDVLFELIDTDDIHLTINVFEKDMKGLRVGQKVMAYTNSDPAKKYPAKIILIGQNVGDDRSVTLHCHFDKPALDLLPGMFMNVEIETAQYNTLSVPNESLVFYGQKNYIFIALDDDTYKMTEVETGVSENGYTALTGDKSEILKSQNIVIRNAYTLLMKMKNTEE